MRVSGLLSALRAGSLGTRRTLRLILTTGLGTVTDGTERRPTYAAGELWTAARWGTVSVVRLLVLHTIHDVAVMLDRGAAPAWCEASLNAGLPGHRLDCRVGLTVADVSGSRAGSHALSGFAARGGLLPAPRGCIGHLKAWLPKMAYHAASNKLSGDRQQCKASRETAISNKGEGAKSKGMQENYELAN